MSIEVWWPRLAPGTRDWLIANNGDAVPATLLEEIEVAGGPAWSDGWWADHDDATGAHMPDAATDWIEEIANQETPAGH